MDTKSKNIRFSGIFKLLAFLMAAAGILFAVARFPGLEHLGYAIDKKEYIDSNTLKQDLLTQVFWDFDPLWLTFESRQAVQDGEYVTDQLLGETKTRLLGAKNDAKNQIYKEYYNEYWFLNSENNLGDSVDEYTAQFRASVLELLEEELEALEASYDTSPAALRKAVIEEQLEMFDQKEKVLATLDKDGYVYLLKWEGKVLSNAQPEALRTLSAKAYYGLRSGESGSGRSGYISEHLVRETDPDAAVVTLGMREELFQRNAEDYAEKRRAGHDALFGLIAGGLVLLLCTGWLIYSAGRRVDAQGVHITGIDIIPLDVAFAAACTGTVLLLVFLFWNVDEWLSRDLPFYPWIALVLFTCIFGIYLLGMTFVIMFVKRLQRKEVFSHTLFYKFLRLCVRALRYLLRPVRRSWKNTTALLREALQGGSTAKRLLVPMLGYAFAMLILMVMFVESSYRSSVFLGMVAALGLVLLHFWGFRHLAAYVSSLRMLGIGVKTIKAGDLNHQIDPLPNSEINEIAQDINTITEGLKIAVANELKSERMKVELITNVSHDIKTPLTSVINYSSLLAEEQLPEPAAGYARILQEKSHRLKNLIEDLFLVSKAQSGAVEINLEPLCINEILNQAMGEFSERFEEANLQCRVRAANPKIMAMGDGARIWRVLSNLLSNAAKYSQPGTRVYFDLYEDEQNAYLTCKNIANYEMNFDPTEMTERFKRGDEARTSEGSGLGLSIADSFMALQGGNLKIETDGDLFKVTLRFPRAAAEKEIVAN